MKKVFRLMMFALISAFALASCEDVPMPYANPNPNSSGSSDTPDVEVDAKGDGTQANPYNVAGVVAYVESLGTDVESDAAVYIKGKVKANSTSEATITQYGNMTFTIIDEGNSSTTFTAFQVYGPGNKKFTSVDQIKEGDEVVVYGKVVNYKGNTPETVGKGAAYVVSINGNSDGGGSSDTPSEGIEVTCAKAAELCNALEDGATSTDTYTITGYITDVYTTISKGQQSFWMADTKDGGKVLQAYWANLPSGVEAFVKGSKVKITGQLMKYVKDGNVTVEVKNANVVILETGDGGSSDQPATGDAKEVNCAKASELALALDDKATSTDTYAVTGYITEVVGSVSKNQQTFWMADTKDGGKVFEAYWANLPEGVTEFTKGSKVKITGQLMRYGTTPEIKNATVVILEKADGGSTSGGDNTGGSDQPTGDGMTISHLPSDITTNAYGSQAVADESTWLTWTWNNVSFAGCRVCKASAISGTIQFQGNDTDAAKQGFIFNKTAWASNIKKITLVIKVQASSTYTPNYSLYVGSEAHPTKDAAVPTSTQSTDASGNKVYTEVYDVERAAAKYFTIANDKAGALYVEKIIVE